MKPFLRILGIAAVLMGLLWVLQGAGVVHWPESSFMLEQRPWILRGGLLAAVGAVMVAASFRRR